MTETEKKALALVNEVRDERGFRLNVEMQREDMAQEALCRAIEQHEAFRQEVSDAVEGFYRDNPYEISCYCDDLKRFIIPKTDPVRALFDYLETTENFYPPEFEGDIRAALAARGLEVRKIGEGE